MTKITKTKWFFDNRNSTNLLCQARKTQNRINPAVTIMAQTTLFQVQNHENKVIFQ